MPPAREKPRSHHPPLSEPRLGARSHLSPPANARPQRCPDAQAAAFQPGGAARRAGGWESRRTPSERPGKVFLCRSQSGKQPALRAIPGSRAAPRHAVPNQSGQGRASMASPETPPHHGGGFLPAALNTRDSERRKIFIRELF